MRALVSLVAVALACGCSGGERLVYVTACPKAPALAAASATSLEEAPRPVPVFRASRPPASGGSACREVPYDASAAPRLFDIAESDDDGGVVFVSDLPFAPGERFVTVRDEENDAPFEQLPVEIVVSEIEKMARGNYRIHAVYPSGMFAPSRVVGPLDAAQHLIGKQGDGFVPWRAEIGKPQLIYQVWLDTGVLESVTVRCSRSVYVDQLWFVGERRTCIRSSFEAIPSSYF